MSERSVERPHRGAKRGIRRGEKRSAILDAAESVFGAQGFAKTTMTDVALAADASRPLLYRYFRDKEGLFEAVVDRVFTEWHEVLLAHVVSEVFLAYADHIVTGEGEGIGERRFEAIIETLLHGFIAGPSFAETNA